MGEVLKLHVINLREQYPMLLHLTSQDNTESGSVDACQKKRMCIVLDWIVH